jgi:hypothetical protein
MLRELLERGGQLARRLPARLFSDGDVDFGDTQLSAGNAGDDNRAWLTTRTRRAMLPILQQEPTLCPRSIAIASPQALTVHLISPADE